MQLKYLLSSLLLFLSLFFTNSYAQSVSKVNLTNEEIEKKIDENSNNPTKMWELINF